VGMAEIFPLQKVGISKNIIMHAYVYGCFHVLKCFALVCLFFFSSLLLLDDTRRVSSRYHRNFFKNRIGISLYARSSPSWPRDLLELGSLTFGSSLAKGFTQLLLMWVVILVKHVIASFTLHMKHLEKFLVVFRKHIISMNIPS
jgi:hypothetical protein